MSCCVITIRKTPDARFAVSNNVCGRYASQPRHRYEVFVMLTPLHDQNNRFRRADSFIILPEGQLSVFPTEPNIARPCRWQTRHRYKDFLYTEIPYTLIYCAPPAQTAQIGAESRNRRLSAVVTEIYCHLPRRRRVVQIDTAGTGDKGSGLPSALYFGTYPTCLPARVRRYVPSVPSLTYCICGRR